MCGSLETSSEVTDDQEKLNNFFLQNNSWNHVSSLYTDSGAQPGGGYLGHLPHPKFSKHSTTILTYMQKLSKNRDEILYCNHF